MQTQPEVIVRVNPDLEPDLSQETYRTQNPDTVKEQAENAVVSPICS